MKRTIAGLLIAGGAIAGLIAFQLWVVNPAVAPRADGGYGEMHGPVEFFKWPVYVVGLLLVIGGIGWSVWNWRRAD